jgi:hypothetical protein
VNDPPNLWKTNFTPDNTTNTATATNTASFVGQRLRTAVRDQKEASTLEEDQKYSPFKEPPTTQEEAVTQTILV